MREKGILTLSEVDWTRAKHRADILEPLSKLTSVRRAVADEAAAQLGVSRRHVYVLLRRFRTGDGLLTDLAPRASSGGRGKSRLPAEVDAIISEALETWYLSKQRYSEAALVRQISKCCRQRGFKPPARNTVRKRIESLNPLMVARRRYGTDKARSLESAAGKTPAASGPLHVVQMDHTKIDLIVVDETSRQPIGRPFLTLAIDIFSRSIVGMLVTFEAPSATSVGLCLTHVVSDKEPWLKNLGLVDVSWPMHGKPGTICSDNGPEFKSEALKRGCEQHGIKLEYRPQGRPHFGGIIERVIGTAMTMIHELPGTTFSNPSECAEYNAQANAALTLRELEQWLSLAICAYHETFHNSLLESPAAVWKRVTQSVRPHSVADGQAFLIDFLPVIRRKIGRVGFVIDHITYYTDVLKPWIADRQRLDKFVIRRDPRDLTRVWVLDPASNCYLEIPYRSLTNPGITLWEHRKAVQLLKERGKAEIDEPAIFRMIDQMRKITETAIKERNQARKDNARRAHLAKQPSSVALIPPAKVASKDAVAKRFDDIEEW
ncbi:MAG TPA: Mu transposase C-terminal domain-containing protein [Candidatus Obscuribacterales bacterium]